MLKTFQDRLLKIISGKSDPGSRNPDPASERKNREGLFGRLIKLGARQK